MSTDIQIKMQICFLWKKKQQQTKNKAKERPSHLFNIFLLTITFFSFFFFFFFNRQLQNVFEHSYMEMKEMIFVCWSAPNAHKYLLSTITDLFILDKLMGTQTGNWSPKCSCYGSACVCIFPYHIFNFLSFDFCGLSLWNRVDTGHREKLEVCEILDWW